MQHAMHRAFQRYGIAMSNSDFRFLCGQIAMGRAVKKCAAKNGAEIYAVSFRGKELNAVWNGATIVTILPFGVPKEMQPYFRAR
jgi:hypothetical protein